MTTNLSPDTAAAETAAADAATRHRVALLALTLAVTAVLATVGGLFWPEPAGGGETYSYADIADQRTLWWGLLMGLAAMAVVNVPMQALAVMVLVRRRGSRLATTGGVLMWVGAGLQVVGVAGWAAVYFFATDPSVDATAGSAVIEAANSDLGHLFGLMIPGAAMVLLGTILQCVGLFRSRSVPKWVPIAALTILLTFVIPGNGVLGLLTSLPMAAGSIGLAYYAWKSVQ